GPRCRHHRDDSRPTDDRRPGDGGGAGANARHRNKRGGWGAARARIGGLRGRFTPRTNLREAPLEWCDRTLLSRIHRYTLHRLRAEIEPVSPADFMRFLFAWQHAAPGERLSGVDGLRRVIERLDGFELAADAWERAVLPARVDGY